MADEPFAARLHFLPKAMRAVQKAVTRLLRSYFDRASGWVLLETTGRRTGLPREVLLPCERSRDAVILISTYGWRSDWIRNIQKEPRVRFTCGGWWLTGRAEIVTDVDRKVAIATAHPFCPLAPFVLVHAILRTVLRPFFTLLLCRWVKARPIVLIRPEALGAPQSAPE